MALSINEICQRAQDVLIKNASSQSEINRQTRERMELAREISSHANWSEARDLYVKMANMPVAMTPSGITDIAKLVYDGFNFHEVNRKMLLVIARRKTKG